MFDLSLVVTAPMATTAPSTGCSGLQAVDPLCYVIGGIGSIGGSVAAAGVDAVLDGISQWVASGAEWLLSQIGSVLNSTTSVDLGAAWLKTHYAVMTALAGVVVVPLLLLSTLQAVVRQNAGQLVRAFLVQLPLALLLGVVAVQIVSLCLTITDDLCTYIAGGSGSDVQKMLASITKGLVLTVGDPTTATFVLLLVGLLVAAAAFVLWLELLVRAAAVYVAVLFLPLVLAALVWPSISQWCRRLVETLAALILSKFVIVATLSLAAGAIGSGSSNVASVLAGGALLVLATFVPFSILRLIPVVEAGAIGHLEGARQRGTAALTSVPRSAAQLALSEGRLARGSAKLAAQTGPPGTGTEPLGNGDGGSGHDIPADPGIPESEAAVMEWLTGPPKPKGPRPVRTTWPGGPTAASAPEGGTDREGDGSGVAGAAAAGSRAAAGPPGPAEAGDGSLPPGAKLLSHAPYYSRFALGTNEGGPVIIGLPPTESPPPGPSSPSTGAAGPTGGSGAAGPSGAAGAGSS